MAACEGEAKSPQARRRPGLVTRQSEPGPKPGTYVITLEIPGIDPDHMEQFEALHAAIRCIATAMFPETWTTFHRVMPDRGKHGGSIDPHT